MNQRERTYIATKIGREIRRAQNEKDRLVSTATDGRRLSATIVWLGRMKFVLSRSMEAELPEMLDILRREGVV